LMPLWRWSHVLSSSATFDASGNVCATIFTFIAHIQLISISPIWSDKGFERGKSNETKCGNVLVFVQSLHFAVASRHKPSLHDDASAKRPVATTRPHFITGHSLATFSNDAVQ